MMFEEFFNKYMEEYFKLFKKLWCYDECEVYCFLFYWFKCCILIIIWDEVCCLFMKVSCDNGVYVVNCLLECICVIYNKVIEWEWEGFNFVDKIRKFKEKFWDWFL